MANTSGSSGVERNNSESIRYNQLVNAEDIRSRAYVLYECRGREDGHDIEDWLLAERQARDNEFP